jgi:hypothetical protein
MKKTDEDRQFALRFAEALQPFVSRDRGKGRSWAQIGADLGVSGPGVQKQLAGGTPSIRTIALAYDKYGVSVPYKGIELAKVIARKGKIKRGPMSGLQLSLPFEITAPVSSKTLILKRLPRGVRRYRLELVIGG